MCLTTFVYGEKYQFYIPFLAYSCNKAYPEYDMHIFVYGQLSEVVRKQLNSLNLTMNLNIHENAFKDFTKMTPFISKTLRWLLWDDVFLKYDYLYTVDIDILYLREPILLHEQHKLHMEMLNLPFSNIARKLTYSPLNPITFLQTIKNFGLIRALQSLAIKRTQYRITGLHFVDVKNYYSKMDKKFLFKHRDRRKEGKMPRGIYRSSDEIYHYKLLEEVGFDLSSLAIQTDSVTMLEPTPNRLEFRPEHGIHLGMFRGKNLDKGQIEILESNAYKYYFDSYVNDVRTDQIFLNLLSIAPDFIKSTFDKLDKYIDDLSSFR